jgi:TIR domain-containing protein
MPAATGDQQVPRPQEVFISYSRKDKEFVRRLYEALSRRDRKAWVDWEDIRPTEDFMQAIYGAIEGADTFIFVLTPDSLASISCGREIAHAAAQNKRMVPIVAREVNADTVPKALAKLDWIFYRDSDDFEKATDELISALDTDLNWVHAHTRLLTRAIEWNANGKSNSFVLRGEDLRAAEQWLAQAGAQKDRQPSAANRIHHCEPQSPSAAAADHAWGRNLRVHCRHRARGRGVLRRGQGERPNEEDERSRQPGQCFARSVLKRRRKERASLGPTCAGVAAESGKSGSLWLNDRYADTAKLACSVNRFNAAR